MIKAQKVIIDGYNVIYTDEELKQLASHDLNHSRNALLERLKMYLEDKDLRVTLVFDGQGGLTDAESVLPEKLQILFSSFDQSADDLIIRTLRDSPNPREFLVVTSDVTDIGRSASAMGAQVITSQDFIRRISKRAADNLASQDEKPKPTEDDTEFWLEKFSEDKEEPPVKKSPPKDEA